MVYSVDAQPPAPSQATPSEGSAFRAQRPTFRTELAVASRVTRLQDPELEQIQRDRLEALKVRCDGVGTADTGTFSSRYPWPLRMRRAAPRKLTGARVLSGATGGAGEARGDAPEGTWVVDRGANIVAAHGILCGWLETRREVTAIRLSGAGALCRQIQEAEFLEEVTGTSLCCVHFYHHEFERCR